jgi:uncharacterized protein
MLRSFIPRDASFFDEFDRLCDIVVRGTEALVAMLREGENLTEHSQRAKALEHEADEMVHVTLTHLHRTFITPLDRDQIHRLVSRIDDILDHAEGAASRLALYQPRQIWPQAVTLAETLVESARLVRELVAGLRELKRKRTERLLELTVEINKKENEADVVRRNAVAHLLNHEKDPFEFIKWKEILDFIEEATDRCENVADIVEGIVLEHS